MNDMTRLVKIPVAVGRELERRKGTMVVRLHLAIVKSQLHLQCNLLDIIGSYSVPLEYCSVLP